MLLTLTGGYSENMIEQNLKSVCLSMQVDEWVGWCPSLSLDLTVDKMQTKLNKICPFIFTIHSSLHVL